MRIEEIRYARQQISKLDWIDQNRNVLVGKGQGAAAVADFNDDGYVAYIILANDCDMSGGRPMAPSGIAVLNLVGANDPREDLCYISREGGGSKAMSLPGQGHHFDGTPEAVAAVAKFLTNCCGFKPVSATASLDPVATARKLFEEFGDYSTLDAQLKADEAMEKGDEKGQKFWMCVHDITLKLSGG